MDNSGADRFENLGISVAVDCNVRMLNWIYIECWNLRREVFELRILTSKNIIIRTKVLDCCKKLAELLSSHYNSRIDRNDWTRRQLVGLIDFDEISRRGLRRRRYSDGELVGLIDAEEIHRTKLRKAIIRRNAGEDRKRHQRQDYISISRSCLNIHV